MHISVFWNDFESLILVLFSSHCQSPCSKHCSSQAGLSKIQVNQSWLVKWPLGNTKQTHFLLFPQPSYQIHMEHTAYLPTCLPVPKFKARGDTSPGDVWNFASLLCPIGCGKFYLFQLWAQHCNLLLKNCSSFLPEASRDFLAWEGSCL